MYGSSGSSRTLRWLKDNEEYKVFVCNRVVKIKEKGFKNWKYVPVKQSPADLGSSDCDIGKLWKDWWEGPVWLSDPNTSPDQPMIESSEESEIERKRVNEILAVTVTSETICDKLNSQCKLLNENLKNFKLDITLPYQLYKSNKYVAH